MRFKLVIDKTQEETVVATVHERSRLTDEPFWTGRPMPLHAAANAAA